MIYSIVELTTNTGITDNDLMSGIPNIDNITCSDLYKNLIEDCGESDYILVLIKSYKAKRTKVIQVYKSEYAIVPEISVGMRAFEYYDGRRKYM